MGLLDRLLGRKAQGSPGRRDTVVGTKVLVASIDDRFAELAGEDAAAYRRFYPATTLESFGEAEAFLRALDRNYDVVHLFCDAGPAGEIGKSSLTGTNLIVRCFRSGVKLLWIAADNDPQSYIRGFNPAGNRINLVMTISRNGRSFRDFHERLLSRMSAGETMPVAWNELCPQIPGKNHQNVPRTIFAAGRGGVRLT
ncbi:MAG: hypothetical protein ACHP84_16515 [Caulobacterales bacterium]